MVGLPPRRPDDVLEGVTDAGGALEVTERRTDLPHRIVVPDRHEQVDVVLVDAVAVVGDEVAERPATLQLVDASVEAGRGESV